MISPPETPKYVEFQNVNPGPGSYIYDRDESQKGFTISGKFKDFEKVETEETPGPGNYMNS